jgi:mannose/fructose/N-acetylgalactosamine-specific phosphotransferase system component IIC
MEGTLPLLNIFLAALAAGIIGLDRLAFGQFMISQPIVAAPAMGFVLGDFHSGLMVGVVLELFWLRGLPVGGHVPKDATLAAILTTGLSLTAARSMDGADPAWIAWVFFWVGLLLIPAGFLNQWIRRKNAWLIRYVLSSSTLDRSISKAVGMGVAIFFIYYFIITFVVVWSAGPLLAGGFTALSREVLQGLRFFFFLLPIIGIASLLTRKDPVKNRRYLLVGAAASLLIFVGLGQQTGWALAVLFFTALMVVFVQEYKRKAV